MTASYRFPLLPVVLLSTALLSVAGARDLAPAYRIENLPATNDSVQTSLIFQTTAGVRYVVERSHDLVQWDPDETFGTNGEIYGMGHECAVPMREFTPPPAPPPGGDPPPPSSIAVNVSVRFARCSDPGGGTVATWPSLTGSGSASVLIAQDMDDGWDSTPLYYREAEEYRIFVWHPVMSAGAPAAVELDPADDDFRDVLVAAFPAMDAEVDASQAAALNAPPPAPPDPNAKVFWRVKADWSVDTDSDGSPDWAEFEMQADPNHPSFALADAFNSDVDNNGVADGEQMDHDGDGVSDGQDSMPFEPRVSSPVIAAPRYALFPITNAQPPANDPGPIQINDRGTVLYSNGSWIGGVWTPLAAPPQDLSEYKALGINDNNEILGSAHFRFHPEVNPMQVLTYSANPQAEPSPVTAGGQYASPVVAQAAGLYKPGPVISNDGRAIGRTSWIVPGEGENRPYEEGDAAHHLWTLPGSGRTAAKGAEVPGMLWVGSQDAYWGWDPENPDETGGITHPLNPPNLFDPPVNVVAATGRLYAFDGKGASSPQTFKAGEDGNNWKSVFTIGNAVDMAADGTVISAKHLGVSAPVLVNGSLKPIADFLPVVAQEWTGNDVSLLDTTPGGWILAGRGPEEARSHAVLLPLRLEGEYEPEGTWLPSLLREGVGVDDISMTSSVQPEGTLNRGWIMAPSGMGETKVRIKVPASATCPLELSAPGLEFDGEETKLITAPDTLVTVKAATIGAPEPGAEVPVTLKLKNGATGVESVSEPFAAKVMKRRTIRVRVWRVKSDAGALPSFNPTQEDLETYLNDVFQPQINAVFDCSASQVIGPLNYDTATGTNFTDPGPDVAAIAAGNGCLDLTEPPAGHEIDMIRTGHYVSAFNINLYLVGGAKKIQVIGDWDHDEAGTEIVTAGGIAHPDPNRREVWFPAELAGTEIANLDRLAHEIGHILFGPGHPNRPQPGAGVAELPHTNRLRRLMCSGGRDGRYEDGKSRIIVKREWDEAVTWFAREISNNRMDP